MPPLPPAASHVHYHLWHVFGVNLRRRWCLLRNFISSSRLADISEIDFVRCLFSDRIDCSFKSVFANERDSAVHRNRFASPVVRQPYGNLLGLDSNVSLFGL